jgi:hypothetical protein
MLTSLGTLRHHLKELEDLKHELSCIPLFVFGASVGGGMLAGPA